MLNVGLSALFFLLLFWFYFLLFLQMRSIVTYQLHNRNEERWWTLKKLQFWQHLPLSG